MGKQEESNATHKRGENPVASIVKVEIGFYRYYLDKRSGRIQLDASCWVSGRPLFGPEMAVGCVGGPEEYLGKGQGWFETEKQLKDTANVVERNLLFVQDMLHSTLYADKTIECFLLAATPRNLVDLEKLQTDRCWSIIVWERCGVLHHKWASADRKGLYNHSAGGYAA